MQLRRALKKVADLGRRALKEIGPIRVDARIDLRPDGNGIDGHVSATQIKDNNPTLISDDSDKPND